jgi:dihydroorotate dehydrogenase
MSLRLWPFVTAFSFTFIPMQHRNSFAGVIAIGWQTYLALLNRRAEKKAEAKAEEATLNAAQAVAEPQT